MRHCPACVSACGITTHSVVAHRAISYFVGESLFPNTTALLNRNIDSIIAGAPFPDYLYTCGSDHDAGEDAHWPPFHAAAADLIRTFPTPWSADNEQFIAFMYGAISHYIADLTWHGMVQTPTGYGFIETLGIDDFNCHGDLCSDAHTAADTGGEFVARFASDLDWFHPEKWTLPSGLLVNVFARIGKNVTTATLDECKLVFLTGAFAVKYLSEIIFPLETDKAPTLVEQYIQLPLGGVDDMAVWSVRMWDRFTTWIANGPPSPPPPLSSSGKFDSAAANPELLSTEMFGKYMQARKLKGGMTKHYREMLLALAPIVSDSPFMPFLRSVLVKAASPDAVSLSSRQSFAASLRRYIHRVAIDSPTNEIEARAKKVVSAFLQKHKLGLKLIETAAPVTRARAVKKSMETLKAKEKKLEMSSEALMQSTTPLEYLGDAVATGDWDADGKPDLGGIL